jgi:hypothetical protein
MNEGWDHRRQYQLFHDIIVQLIFVFMCMRTYALESALSFLTYFKHKTRHVIHTVEFNTCPGQS